MTPGPLTSRTLYSQILIHTKQLLFKKKTHHLHKSNPTNHTQTQTSVQTTTQRINKNSKPSSTNTKVLECGKSVLSVNGTCSGRGARS